MNGPLMEVDKKDYDFRDLIFSQRQTFSSFMSEKNHSGFFNICLGNYFRGFTVQTIGTTVFNEVVFETFLLLQKNFLQLLMLTPLTS